jgi:hypothetical protein
VVLRRSSYALAFLLSSLCYAQNGLIARFGSVVFEVDSPHFFLDAGEALHPQLAASASGYFEGSLQVLAAGDYEFSRSVVLDGRAGLRHALTAGKHALRIEVAGERSLRLLWKSAAFDWEPVPRAAFFRNGSVASFEEGRRLVVKAGCANCHPAPAPEVLERIAPALDGYQSRSWLAAFLPGHFGGVARDAKNPPALKTRRANEVAIGKGGELFGTLGCVNCHATGTLTSMGAKYSLSVLTWVLLEAHQPSMLLDEDDATALAAYLTRSGDAPVRRASGDLKYDEARCISCHTMAKNAAPLERLRSTNCRSVPVSWTADQAAKAAEYIRSIKPQVSPAPTYTLRRELEKHQCLACHQAGTDAPSLEGAGAKLKTSWIDKVLSEKKRIRAGREMRMPHYAASEVKGLAAALAKIEGLAAGDGAVPPAFDSAVRERGIGLFGTNIKKQGMACIGCHDWGANKALGEEGPQLQNAAERLRFDWYERWMRNPARILSGTSMPSYFGGKLDPRIHALWAAMEWGSKAPVPDGFRVGDLEVSSEAKPVVGKEAVVIRWDMPGATPAAIAVGLPGGFSYCFDAGQTKLLYAWKGGFLDMTGTLLRKVDANKMTPTAALVGSIVWRAAADYPVLVGAEKRTPQRKFKGYQLVDGAPRFLYSLDHMNVVESISAGKRRLEFDVVDGPVYFEGKLVPVGRGVVMEGALQ